jgi:hypothetical protein
MLLIAMAVISVVLVPTRWFGAYYLLPATLSLAMVGGCLWAYAAGRPVALLVLAIASTGLGIGFGLVAFAWHAALVLFLSLLCWFGKAEVRRYAVAILLIGVVPFGLVYGPDFKRAREFAEKLRQYPLRSVAARLEFEREARRRDSSAGLVPLATYSANVLAAIEAMEQRVDFENFGHVAALEKLHNATYREFVQAPGFGFGRMKRVEPRLQDIGLPPRQVIELPLPVEGTTRPIGPELLSDVHRLAERDSFSRARIGYVRSRDEVAGFEPHGFGQLNANLRGIDSHASWIVGRAPVASEETRSSHWQVARLELVSLLRHDEPRVYLSNKLPQMDQLAEVPNRELDEFEASALPQLRFDEDLVTDITGDRIKMLGSIRAGNDCLQCHRGDRGQLLGAFSYELTPTAGATGGE